MNTPLKYFTTPQPTEPFSYPLCVNGKEITSLPMLRTQVKPEELYPLLHDHSLLHWFVAQGQEHLAYTLAQLLRTVKFTEEFCSILGFPSEHNRELSREELHAYAARKKYISRYTDDETILSNPYSVALNQNELNEILFLGVNKIYLCEEAFKIPTEITDVCYVGIGGAVIRQPLSPAEYSKHNITVENIPLPGQPADYISEGYKEAKAQFNVLLAHSATERLIPSFLKTKMNDCKRLI